MGDEDMQARQELMGTITPTNIVGDAEALLAHADGDPNTIADSVGVVGFCMTVGLGLAVARARSRPRRRDGVDPRRVARARHRRLAAP